MCVAWNCPSVFACHEYLIDVLVLALAQYRIRQRVVVHVGAVPRRGARVATMRLEQTAAPDRHVHANCQTHVGGT